MRKKLFVLSIIASLLMTSLSVFTPVVADIGPDTVDYGDITLNGGFQAGHFCDVWDLTTGDMEISFTYDGNGLVDDAGAHAWAELGIRTIGYGDFNPTWDVEGAGVWLATDYDWTTNTFDPDPVGAPTLDLDDKLILQKAGGHGEGDYNLPSTPPAPGNNHRVWWDRDGVDPWQNPETANTGGIYQIVITLHATGATSGTAYMKIRGLYQGFETDGNWNTIELTPAGMTFTGDMRHMQVFYGLYGYGATHSVAFNDITVKGKLNPLKLQFDSSSDSIKSVGSTATLKVQLTDTVGTIEGWNVKFESASADLTVTPNPQTTDSNGVAQVTATATSAGVYTVIATVKICPEVTISDTWTLVFYDPSGGFVTGGGWINSPAGAYAADSSLTGKATFGFVSKYQKGASVPTGQTEFQFRVADLNFHSTSYQWLVVSGSKAKYKGEGTINGQGGYGFMLSAVDGQYNRGTGADTFRIKIWDKSTGAIIYDNQMGFADDADATCMIQGGNIIVHK